MGVEISNTFHRRLMEKRIYNGFKNRSQPELIANKFAEKMCKHPNLTEHLWKSPNLAKPKKTWSNKEILWSLKHRKNYFRRRPKMTLQAANKFVVSWENISCRWSLTQGVENRVILFFEFLAKSEVDTEHAFSKPTLFNSDSSESEYEVSSKRRQARAPEAISNCEFSVL